VEIGDLDERQAITFLTTRYRADETTAKDIYDIAGGRIKLLTGAIQNLQDQTLKEIRNEFVHRAAHVFGDLTLPKDSSELTLKQKKAWQQIIQICDSPNKAISYTDFRASLGSLADELLQRNIFAFHHGNNTVSLQSRPMELFVEQQRELFVEQQPQVVEAIIKSPKKDEKKGWGSITTTEVNGTGNTSVDPIKIWGAMGLVFVVIGLLWWKLE